MDIPYTVRRKGRKVALHVEFQKQQDDDMGRRVWEYNVLTCVRTGLPVYSVVLYLVKDAPIVESPYTVELSADEIIHHFVFQNVKLWEIPPEVLIEQKLPGLLPLLPLTKEGNRREVVEQMMNSLQQTGKNELIALGYAFAVRLLEKEIDQQWLRENFMSVENIFEGTWMYDEIIKKGMVRGLEQGAQKELQALCTTLMRFVETHFPDQLALAQQQVELTTTPSQVQELLDRLFVARTNDEVRKTLLAIPHA
jgi:predicted transposase YdaD